MIIIPWGKLFLPYYFTFNGATLSRVDRKVSSKHLVIISNSIELDGQLIEADNCGRLLIKLPGSGSYSPLNMIAC